MLAAIQQNGMLAIMTGRKGPRHEQVTCWIKWLNLQLHPEGGWYRETYRSAERVPAEALPDRFASSRCLGTAIYYLLEGGQRSKLHRIKSDEIWHFYDGDALTIHMFSDTDGYRQTVLGRRPHAGECLQAVVPAGCWFGAEPGGGSGFSLVGCTVAPGFEFADFEFADRASLIRCYPALRDVIMRLTQDAGDDRNACKTPSS